jgi:hypothetical protein
MFEESLSRVAYWQGASPRPPATTVYGYRELPGVCISLEGAIASMVSLLAWDCRLPMGKPKWREVRAEAGVADDPGEFERTSCSIRGAQACRVLPFGGASASMSTSI